MIERYNRIHPKPQESPPPAKLDTRNSIEAICDARIAAVFEAEDFNQTIGDVIAHERHLMRDHVAQELRSLRRELAEARAQIKKLESQKAAQEIIGWKIDRSNFAPYRSTRTVNRERQYLCGFYFRSTMTKSVDKRLRAQGYKPIEECDRTPEQRAFAEGFKAGWNACSEHHEELRNQIEVERARCAAIEAALAAERDDDDPPRLN